MQINDESHQSYKYRKKPKQNAYPENRAKENDNQLNANRIDMLRM